MSVTRNVILASQSPRRRGLLTQMGLKFTVSPQNIDEESLLSLPPEEYVAAVSEKKAESAQKRAKEDDVIIAADTIVVIDDEILGKPKDRQDAVKMLMRLSGRTHTVMTGVCVIGKNKKVCFTQKTDVEFINFDEAAAKGYAETGECDDKAGSYGLQGKGGLLIKAIYGDCYTVIGLPIARLAQELLQFGIKCL